jgi:hypothetical protein
MFSGVAHNTTHCHQADCLWAALDPKTINLYVDTLFKRCLIGMQELRVIDSISTTHYLQNKSNLTPLDLVLNEVPMVVFLSKKPVICSIALFSPTPYFQLWPRVFLYRRHTLRHVNMTRLLHLQYQPSILFKRNSLAAQLSDLRHDIPSWVAFTC